MKYLEENYSLLEPIDSYPYQGSKPFANGWFSEEEGDWYHQKCSSIFNGNIVEIGSYEGLSLSYIKDTISENNNKIWSVEAFCNKRLVRNVNDWGVNLICEPSLVASKAFPSNFFDFIFIDALHQYKHVKADILNWMPLLKPNGIIAGHDYDDFWPGVKKAVDEIFPERKVVGRIWYFRRSMIF